MGKIKIGLGGRKRKPLKGFGVFAAVLFTLLLGATTSLLAQGYTLNVSKSGNGTVRSQVAGIDCGSDCTEAYNTGTVVTLTAAPDTGSYFAGWSDGTDTYQALTWKVMMDKDKTVTATFNTGTPPTVTTWAKTYGGSGGDAANAIQQTSDGGYIVAGYTFSFGAGDSDFWVLKLTADGSVAWQKTYGGSPYESPTFIQQTWDGGYIVAGETNFGAGSGDVWVLKLDSLGNVTWQKTFGGSKEDNPWSIQQTSDGGYIVAGYTYSFGQGFDDSWVLKLDSLGNVTWQKTFGGPSLGIEDGAWSIQQTLDGGYIVGGYTQLSGAWILKLNGDGNIEWQKTYTILHIATSIQQTSDGGYIVAGGTTFSGAGGTDFLVLKLNANGNIEWQKTYGGPSDDNPLSIQQTSDDGYFVAGITNSFGAGGYDALVIKLDSMGTVVWQKTYGGSDFEFVNLNSQQTSDGGYIVAAQTRSFGAGGYDALVIKLDSDGNIFGCPAGLIRTPSVSVGTPTGTATSHSSTIGTSSATVTNTTVTPVTTTVIPGSVCTGIQTYSLTIVVSGAGSVTLDPLGGTYNSGASVTLTPYPGADYFFYQWSGGGCSGSGSCIVTMDANKTVTATFLLSAGDSDGDGLPDGWEMANFGNLNQVGSGDPDGDGYSNAREFALGTNPNNFSSYPTGYVPDAERAALIDLYNFTNSPGWNNKGGWDTMTGPECSWYGIICTGDGHVEQIKLDSNNLQGTIPSSIRNLTNLLSLYLSSNQLTGSIPPELGSMTNLQILNLSYNQLTGSIPPRLGSMTNLLWLYLYNNQLSGTIPKELKNLTNLLYLCLFSNQLTGPIPPELGLGSLENLLEISLHDNQLTGSIPPELGNLIKLEALSLAGNQLTGPIPDELASLTNLVLFALSANQLTGPIPAWLGSLTKLEYLNLAANQLTGSIPDSLGSLNNLQNINLSSNHLTGSIPAWLESLTKLEYLYLSSNQLTGTIPDSLGSLINLRMLWLYGNQLTGPIPVSLKNLTQLTNNVGIDLRWNALYTTDDTLRTFLNSKQNGGNWENTQTVAPTNLTATALSSTSVQLTWTPIIYTGDTGGYEVYYSMTSGGTYTYYTTTAAKSDPTATVTGLTAGIEYFFRIRTVTNPHANNQNTVYSDYTSEVAEKQLLTVVKLGNGTVRSQVVGIDCGSTCSQSYDVGTIVTLTAAPDSGSYFGGWSGPCLTSGLTCKVTMDETKTVTANFTTTPPAVTTWAKTYGGSSYDSAESIQQTSDGGYIVAGKTGSFGAGNYDMWVLKLNADGSVAWQKTYGGAGYDSYPAPQQTSDGGYIVAGGTNSFGAGGYDFWVLKLNADGSVAWQKTYGGVGGYDIAFSIQQTSDGGYIVAGQTTSFGAGNTDAWVLKLNPDGSVAWQKTYGGAADDFAYSIQQTSDGGYIVAASTSSFGAGSTNAWVLKLNANGSLAWQKTYGGTAQDFAGHIQQTSDGGYIVAGYTTSFGAGNYDAWVLKLNPDGSVAWQKTYGGAGYDLAGIQQTSDGGYIVAAATSSFGAGNYDAWVLKLNPDGSVAWQKTYGSTGDDSPGIIQQTSDGGYIMPGYTTSFGAGNYDAWVLKLDSNGNIDGCPAGLIGVTTVTGVDTSATITTPTPTITDTSATVTDTNVTPVNTTVAPGEVCTGIFPQYTITAQASPPEGGSITPGSQTVNSGATATFTVTATPGYTASVSEGTLVGNTWTIPNVTSTHTATVTFTPTAYTVTASVSGENGTLYPASQSVGYNGTATITFYPTGAYYVALITDNGLPVTVANPYVISNVTADHNVVVTFAAPNTYLITVSPLPTNGYISCDPTIVNSGGGSTCTITPNPNYHILSVSVDGTPVGTPTSYPFINVMASHWISASFAVNPTFTITASADACSTISPSGTIPNLPYDWSQPFAIEAAGLGCIVTDVIVDGESRGALTSYTFEHIMSDHTIQVLGIAGDPVSGDPTARDDDRDNVLDYMDNCPGFKNTKVASWIDINGVTHTDSQRDTDLDGYGDGCDTCPNFYNPDQTIPKWYKDKDNDRYADSNPATIITACARPTMYSIDGVSPAYKLPSEKVCQNNRSIFCTNDSALCTGTSGSCIPALLSISGDTNDENPDIYPGAPVSNPISFAMSQSYNDWLPYDGANVTVTATVNGGSVNSLTVLSVTSWPGKYTNHAPAAIDYNSLSDYTCNGTQCAPGMVISGNSVDLVSLDFGGSITIQATATLSGGGSVNKDFTLPKDTVGLGLPDKFQLDKLGVLGYGPNDDPDGDGITIFKEYRGFKWGNLVENVNNDYGYCSNQSSRKCNTNSPCASGGTCVAYSYQTPAYVPELRSDGEFKIDHFRTHPLRKDLFVKFRYFDWDHPFAIGKALYNAGIDVHAVDYDAASQSSAIMNQQGIGVLSINNDGASVYPDSVTGLDSPYHVGGHTAHRTGRIRDWEWSTKGVCPPGSAITYGTCTAYQLALDNYFNDMPYKNGNTCPSSSTNCSGSPWPTWDPANTVLDPVNRVEDQNDNAVNTKIGTNNYEAGPSASSPWNSDVRVPGSFLQDLSPFNPSNMRYNNNVPMVVELPVGNASNRFTKPQVLKHTITHEIIHGAGDGPHNSDPNCLMYEWSNNWSRDNNLSNYAKGLLKIHNP